MDKCISRLLSLAKQWWHMSYFKLLKFICADKCLSAQLNVLAQINSGVNLVIRSCKSLQSLVTVLSHIYTSNFVCVRNDC